MTKTKRKGLSRKERMAMAQTTAGISFWVDLRKGRLSRYTIQKRVKKTIASLYFDFTWFCHPDTTVKVGKGRVYGSERTCK